MQNLSQPFPKTSARFGHEETRKPANNQNKEKEKRQFAAATDNEKSDAAIMSDNNTDNATTVDGNMDNTTTGKTSTVQVPLPPHKIKTSTKHMPTIAEPSIGDPLPNENATAKASGHTVDPTDVCIYEFLIQGAPNPCDLEGIEEDQLLEIQ